MPLIIQSNGELNFKKDVPIQIADLDCADDVAKHIADACAEDSQ